MLPHTHSDLLVDIRLDAGRLFEDIEESSRTIDSVALRIANPFYDTRPFESFDGAQGGGKRNRQFLRHSFGVMKGFAPKTSRNIPISKKWVSACCRNG